MRRLQNPMFLGAPDCPNSYSKPPGGSLRSERSRVVLDTAVGCVRWASSRGFCVEGRVWGSETRARSLKRGRPQDLPEAAVRSSDLDENRAADRATWAPMATAYAALVLAKNSSTFARVRGGTDAIA